MNIKLRLYFFLCLYSFSLDGFAQKDPYPNELFSSFQQKVYDENLKSDRASMKFPSWSSWEGQEMVLKIDRQTLEQGQVFLFGVNCAAGDHCSRSFASSAAQRVRFEKRGTQLFIVSEEHGDGPALDPIIRWEIVKSDQNFVFAQPFKGHPVSLDYFSNESHLKESKKLNVYDRFFHDLRSSKKGGIWFHETIRYRYNDLLEHERSLFRSSDDNLSLGASTFTHFILPLSELSEGFETKIASEDFGYFVNTKSFASPESSIYERRGDNFNSQNLKAIRWNEKRHIEWVVERDLPDKIYPYIKKGIMSWTEHLPSTLTFSIRRAREDEELNSPYINPVLYEVNSSGGIGGVGNTLYDIKTGEIFRGGIIISGPSSLPDEKTKQKAQNEFKEIGNLNFLSLNYGEMTLSHTCQFHPEKTSRSYTREEAKGALKGVAAHEVGHALGLRHNFLGHTYDDEPKLFPAGSSVMDYPVGYYKMKIGPYDIQAIEWGYTNSEVVPKYNFCTDEQAGFLPYILNIRPDCRRFAPVNSNLFNYEYDQFTNFLKKIKNQNEDIAQQRSKLSGMMNLATYFLRSPLSSLYYDNTKSKKASKAVYKKVDIMLNYEDYLLERNGLAYDFMSEANKFFEAISDFKSTPDGGYFLFQKLDNDDLYLNYKDLILDYLKAISQIKASFEDKKAISKNLAEWLDEDPYGFYFATNFIEYLKKVAEKTDDSSLKKENLMLIYLMNQH